MGARKRPHDDCDDEEEVKPTTVDTDEDSDSSEEDSDDDEDDENGEGTGVVEHHESSEEFPNCVAYDQGFYQISRDLTDIPKRALEILERSECNNKRIKTYIKHAEDFASPPQAKREKVALLGNTGAGN